MIDEFKRKLSYSSRLKTIAKASKFSLLMNIMFMLIPYTVPLIVVIFNLNTVETSEEDTILFPKVQRCHFFSNAKRCSTPLYNCYRYF